jgi:site-specific recombinase XerD
MSGASLLDIAHILGHKSLSMTQRYAHLSTDHTHAVVERMNQAILG